MAKTDELKSRNTALICNGISDDIGEAQGELDMVLGAVETTIGLSAGGVKDSDSIEPEAIFNFMLLVRHHLLEMRDGLNNVQEKLHPHWAQEDTHSEGVSDE